MPKQQQHEDVWGSDVKLHTFLVLTQDEDEWLGL